MKNAGYWWSKVNRIQRFFRKALLGEGGPQAAVQSAGGGAVINSTEELERVMRGILSGSGTMVNATTAMRTAAVYRSVSLISGAVATMPLDIMRIVDDRVRNKARDHPVWKLLKKKPNRWQTPSQFKRMMEAHKLLRGNAYALIVRSMDRVVEVIPLDPDRMECKQNDSTLVMEYIYTHKNGQRSKFNQTEIFHLVGLTLDGVHGVTPITYARETIGAALAADEQSGRANKSGLRHDGTLVHPGKLGIEGLTNLKASLDEFRSGGKQEGKTLVLEEGIEFMPMTMSAADAQWIESRKFSRTDIAMFFGVPPHLLGDTEKSTSWGTGLEQQTQGFVTFTLEDNLTTWEETVDRDLIADNDNDEFYARFVRRALVRGDLKARKEFYVSMAQWGVLSPNEIRELEDMNPREGGDVYYDPPNTAGTPADEKEIPDEPEKAA